MIDGHRPALVTVHATTRRYSEEHDPLPSLTSQPSMTQPTSKRVERKVYSNDPIQEALCEFRFRAPTEGWAVLPGRLYERLADLYPADPAVDAPFRGVTAPQGPVLSSLQIAVGQGVPGNVRLRDAGQSRGVLVGPGIVNVFVRKPYPRWEVFSEHIIRVITAFSEVAGDFDVERIGLRYVNQIEVPDNPVDIERYFMVHPLRFTEMNLTLRNFIGRSEQYMEDDPDRLVVATFASAQPQLGGTAFILDLDAIAQNLQGVNAIDDLTRIVKELRWLEKDVFEASVTNEARTVFGQVEILEESGAF